MKVTDKYYFRQAVLFGIVMSVLAFYFQFCYGLLFMEMETRLLFVYDFHSLWNAIMRPGGFAAMLDSFLVQFFHIAGVGPCVAAMALAFVLFFSYPRWFDDRRPSILLPLCILPIVFLIADIHCAGFSFENIIVFLLLSFFIHLYEYDRHGLHRRNRILRVPCIVLFLYMAVGDMVICYLFSVLILDLSKKRSLAPGLSALAVVLVIMLLSEKFYWTGGMKEEMDLDKCLFYAAWISFTGFLAVVPECRLVFYRNGRVFIYIFIGIIVSGTGFCLLQKHRHIRREQLAVFSYFAQNERWNDMLRYSRSIDMNNYMLLNYTNLALSSRNILLEHYSDYRHDSEQVLCIKPDLTPEGMQLLSMVYYHIGNVAGAQRMAFEAYQCNSRPWLLQMLVKTNIVFGSYSVAEKYISILEKTLFYRRWALSMRAKLTDSAFEEDNELRMKRAGLPETNNFIHADNLFLDCMDILDGNKSNAPARNYLMAYLLISRDASLLFQFVDRFYGTPALPVVPPDMQYGLLFATADPDYCRRHGVSEKIISSYLLGNRRNK